VVQVVSANKVRPPTPRRRSACHACGATVNFLVGKIGRDPAPWSDPVSFKPERFMPGGVDLTCTRELKMMSFGTGRRICPGLAPVMLHLEYFVTNLVREFEWWEVDSEEVNLDEFHESFFTVTATATMAKRCAPRTRMARTTPWRRCAPSYAVRRPKWTPRYRNLTSSCKKRPT
jgi:hypothetical protein